VTTRQGSHSGRSCWTAMEGAQSHALARSSMWAWSGGPGNAFQLRRARRKQKKTVGPKIPHIAWSRLRKACTVQYSGK
jgi:hypothetical protein